MNLKITKFLCIILMTITLAILSACNSQPPKSDDTNMGTITLKVGDSATCYAAGSCTVYLIMPVASGNYTVTQDGPNGTWKAGTFAAQGQTVLLGQFYGGRTSFTIEGVDVPKTWVTVVTDF